MGNIRFRAWDNIHNEMFFDALHGFNGGIFVDTEDGYEEVGGILMQYTGLKDKNNRKIFCGDIVQDGWDKDNIGEVTFEDGSFSLGIGYVECLLVQAEDCEIIGNIHENPELLK